MRTKRLIAAYLIGMGLAMMLAATGCAKNAPPSLTPHGVKVWQAKEAAVYLNTAVDATIGLNGVQVCSTATDCHPLLSDTNTRGVLHVFRSALHLLDTTPENWKVIATEALTQAEATLDDFGKMKLVPYLRAAAAALATIAS